MVKSKRPLFAKNSIHNSFLSLTDPLTVSNYCEHNGFVSVTINDIHALTVYEGSDKVL